MKKISRIDGLLLGIFAIGLLGLDFTKLSILQYINLGLLIIFVVLLAVKYSIKK
jgi:hypothetical protein